MIRFPLPTFLFFFAPWKKHDVGQRERRVCDLQGRRLMSTKERKEKREKIDDVVRSFVVVVDVDIINLLWQKAKRVVDSLFSRYSMNDDERERKKKKNRLQPRLSALTSSFLFSFAPHFFFFFFFSLSLFAYGNHRNVFIRVSLGRCSFSLSSLSIRCFSLCISMTLFFIKYFSFLSA